MKKKRILVCPLDWGLGHASRDVPLVKKLLGKNFEVILGGDGASLEFLKIQFPDLEVIHIYSHTFIYSKFLPAWFMIMVQIPAFITGIIKEHLFLKNIIEPCHIDAVISDARYGLWNRQVHSVILTHQIQIKMPRFFKVFEPAVNYLNRLALGKFSRVWIPDLPGTKNLSGYLSGNRKLTCDHCYVGILSGFKETHNISGSDDNYELVLLLSGPEPQRSVLEKKVTGQLIKYNRKSLVIGGQTGKKVMEKLSESCQKISFLSGEGLYNILINAKYIICRSGYSTIMDMAAIRKTAFLVPTPGQPEQEYLASHLLSQGLFLFSAQKDFNLEYAIRSMDNFMPGDFPSTEDSLLDTAIHQMINITVKTTMHPVKKPV